MASTWHIIYQGLYFRHIKFVFLCCFSAPKIFPIAYALVKPFLNEVTRNKVKILGGMTLDCSLVYLFVWSVRREYIKGIPYETLIQRECAHLWYIVFVVGDWKTEILEYIDESNLPEYYGGKCRDPDGDPLCRSRVHIFILSDISQLLHALWLVNLVGRVLLYSLLKFKTVWVAKKQL